LELFDEEDGFGRGADTGTAVAKAAIVEGLGIFIESEVVDAGGVEEDADGGI
jgi:hypothetical protein